MEALFGAFGIDWKLLIAQAVNFGVLFVALSYLLYTPVLSMLEKRKEVVAKGVQDAEAAAELLAGADAQARDEAGQERTRLLKEAEERAAGIANDAEARASETAARALRESEKEIARLAILAAEKVMRKEA